jgi:hypothetical protein
MKENYDINICRIVLSNIVLLLRRVAQSFDLAKLINSEPVYSITLVDIFEQFLNFIAVTFSDTKFLDIPYLKTAINYCVIVEKLCEASCSASRNDCNKELGSSPVQKYISMKSRKRILLQLFDWFDEITLINSTVVATARNKLLDVIMQKIGSAISSILKTGMPYNESLPHNFLKDILSMKLSGHAVMESNLLCNHDEALGVTLSSSYAGRGSNSPFDFTESIFNILLPSIDDNPNLFVNSTNDISLIFESFGSISLSPSNYVGTLKKEHTLSKDEIQNLSKHMGSLIFHCINRLTM